MAAAGLAAFPCAAQEASQRPAVIVTTGRGALVAAVVADGPADRAGIEVNDVLVGMDGLPLQSALQIGDILSRYAPGDTVTMQITRAADGSSADVSVTIGRRPGDPTLPYLGLTFSGWVRISPRTEGSSDDLGTGPVI